MLEGYDAKVSYKGLRFLSDQYDRTFLDPSFQRNGGVERGSGWTETQSVGYMSNLISHKTCNLVIRASVKHCLDFAREQNDEESITYFSEVSEDYDYISIDGNNSSSTIHHFLQDKLKALQPSKFNNGLSGSRLQWSSPLHDRTRKEYQPETKTRYG